MPNYFFTAKSQQGETKTGTKTAKNRSDLAAILRQEGYVLISAVSEEEKASGWPKLQDLAFFTGVGLKDKMFFTRNLQVMIGAGVSLPRSLRVLADQSKNRKMKKTLLAVQEDLNKGQSFSEALKKHPSVFSELFYSMVKVGEEAGTMEEVLKNLTFQMEREYEIKSKIKGALMYPAVIIAAMAGIGVLMLVMVVPKLAETFEEMNLELPLMTKLVIGTGTFLAERWYFALIIIGAVAVASRFGVRTAAGKRILDTVSLHLPVVSSIVKKTNSGYTARTLSSLIVSGVPIVRSLEIISESLGNLYYKKAIREALEKVRKGGKLSEALRPWQDIYPLTIIQMIEVGEETGKTAEVLAKISEFFEEEVTATTKNLTAIVEPILMLIIGGAVGFFAISMIQPMYSMLSAF